MHADIVTNRRVLLLTYQRYLKADRAWNIAMRDAKSWFPAVSRPSHSTIGNPGSPIRQLYDQRARALLQLEAARLKLETAKQRSAERRRKTQVSRVVLITYAAH